MFQIFEEFIKEIFFIFIKNVKLKNQQLFPFITALTILLILFNIMGMLPFGFTITSHFSITFFLSFLFFISLNYIGIRMHKIEFLSLFLPSGTPLIIMPFLFLIELLSYISRLFSLAIRLFANMLSGHILLKILISFV
jgi:F-type H+-transporting ATPase subunit a